MIDEEIIIPIKLFVLNLCRINFLFLKNIQWWWKRLSLYVNVPAVDILCLNRMGFKNPLRVRILPAELNFFIMLCKNNNLIRNRNLNSELLDCNSNFIETDNEIGIQQTIAGNGVLPLDPFFEIHPYKDSFVLQAYKKIIIGTFPPISYLYDNLELLDERIVNLFQPTGTRINEDRKSVV